jgi:hypothetical protein
LPAGRAKNTISTNTCDLEEVTEVNQRAQKNRDDQKLNSELPQLQTPSAGQPLEPQTRALMEPRFAHSFANVRVHADAAADQLARGYEAQAFAFGDDLYFRDGAYDPSSAQGLHTLAHELTHVVQQSGHAKDGLSEKVASSHSRSETEAHAAARTVTMGGHANVSAGSAGAVQVSKMGENENVSVAASLPPTLPPPMTLPPTMLTSPISTLPPPPASPMPSPINPLNPSFPLDPGVPIQGTQTRAGPGYNQFLHDAELTKDIANAESRLAAGEGTAATETSAANSTFMRPPPMTETAEVAEAATSSAEATAATSSAEVAATEATVAEAATGAEVVAGETAVAGAEATAVTAGAEGGALGAVGAGIGAVALPLLAGLGTLLWSNKTAPRWMDEMNPLTGKPYASEQEFQQARQEMQRRALKQQAAGTPSTP